MINATKRRSLRASKLDVDVYTISFIKFRRLLFQLEWTLVLASMNRGKLAK